MSKRSFLFHNERLFASMKVKFSRKNTQTLISASLNDREVDVEMTTLCVLLINAESTTLISLLNAYDIQMSTKTRSIKG